MTNKETVERWAEFIIPVVFKAEDALLKERTEWKERLKNITNENVSQISEQYCKEIATIIVKGAIDYKPDGTLEDEDDKI